jgi:hypothetical protein
MKIFAFVVLLALVIGAVLSEVASAESLELITAKEAEEPNLSVPKSGTSGEFSRFHGRTPMPGAPQIVVEEPQQQTALSTPFPVRIRFIPSRGARINLNSVEVDLLKLTNISLFSRVIPYLTEKGIDIPQAKVPDGTHHIEIAVADNRGRIGSTVQTWMVV